MNGSRIGTGRVRVAAGMGWVVLGVVAAAARAGEPPAPEPPTLTVRVDPRVELVSILFRLAGHPEYNRGRIAGYVADVEAHFGGLRDHEAVRMARRLRAERGVSYDACMSLAVHLTDDGATFAERVPFDPRPDWLDARWTPETARAFRVAACDFAEAGAFRRFFADHRTLYDAAETRLRARLDDRAHLEWFPAFFGARPASRFHLAIGLLNGPSCYGPRCRMADGTEELYCILGAWETDAEGLPVFGGAAMETVVHEFCHSFANPIIDAHTDALAAPGAALYAPVAATMARQAYGNPTTMLYETLVRACTVRYLRQHSGPLVAFRKVVDDQSRGFRLVGPLSTFLAEYEQERERYPTLESFAPRLIAFFDEQARELGGD